MTAPEAWVGSVGQPPFGGNGTALASLRGTMVNGWVLRATFAIGLAVAIILSAQSLGQLPGGIWSPAAPSIPDEGRASEPSTTAPTPGCVRDPANLPPPPPGPEGRPSNYLHSCGNRLYDAHGKEVRITGLNWNGMESSDYVPGGLGRRKWQEILDLVASLGYNTIRLPFSNEALEPGRQVKNVDFDLNPDLRGKSPLEALDLLIAGARERGLKVILDRHRTVADAQIQLWYDSQVSEERWIADWRMLAARYAGDDTIIGVDLSNEPRGAATWGSEDPATDWRLAAERAGNAVLEENPYLLILVEGIESFDGDGYWWGGNLQGVRSAPVRLKVPNRVVYSPHDYGPSISHQPWFSDPLFPGNLPEIWDRQWGYIHREGIAPVVVGEFGGRSVGDDRDGQWQKVLLAYLRRYGIGALVWSLNPNWDTGGVIADDWNRIETAKHEVYRQILAAPLDVGAAGLFGRAPTRLSVLFSQGQTPTARPHGAAFAFQIANDGPDRLDLSRFELRYWPGASGGIDAGQEAAVEAPEPVGGNVLVDIVSTGQGGANRYLRVRFDRRAGSVDRYGTSDPLTIRFPATDPPGSDEMGSHSLAPLQGSGGSPIAWDRVALYLDGRLVWGGEP